MKRLSYLSSLAVLSLFGSIALTGCGMGSSSYGVVGDMPTSESSPPLQGSVYGGHAPLVGARVYILTPSTSGNPNVTAGSGASTSLMSSTGPSSMPIYDGIVGSPGNGMYYVVTDSTGAYNLTGDYACTENRPVYLAAVGGTPTLTAPPALTVTSVAITGTGTTRTFTYTTATPSGYSVGEYVSVTGYTDTPTGTPATESYNRAGFVTAVSLPAQTFSIVANYTTSAAVAGNPTVTGYPGWNPAAINLTSLGLCPSSASGVGFKGVLNYIYTNEVSTASLAMAAGAFGTDAFHIGVQTNGTVDAHYGGRYDIGALGLAFNNAGLLYDISGGNLTTSVYGEGHIARPVTPNGNGVPPQALMDTLGNILASCVDSSNTGVTANFSATCAVLFDNASSTGKLCTGGTGAAAPTCPTGTTAPADIAAAAFNIAHHPAGDPSNTNFVSTLYNLPGATVPFTPNLSANPSSNGQPAGQPNDFTATIAFTAPRSSGSTDINLINQPQVISIDGGNYVGDEYGGYSEGATDYQEGVWIGNYGSQAVKLFANGGIPDYPVNLNIANSTYGARSVTVDSNATTENVWFANPNTPSVVEYSIAGTSIYSYSPASGDNDALNLPSFLAIDGAGNQYGVYIPQYGGNNLLKLDFPDSFIGGAFQNVSYACFFRNFLCADYGNNTAFSNAQPCLSQAASVVFNPAGTLYTYGGGSGDICTLDTEQGTVNTTKAGFTSGVTNFGPSFFSIDHTNKLWATNATAETLISYTAGGAATSYTGGGLNLPCSTAVDGAGNIWVGNAGTYGVSEFTGAGVPLSPAAGAATLALGGYSPQLYAVYSVGGTPVFQTGGTASNCASPAIDRAGNVWVVYQGTASTLAPGVVFEILGAAAPTVTPLAYATFGNGTTGFLGTRP